MKRLIEYIQESIKTLKSNEKGIIVFDIDDTLIKTDSNIVKVIKYENGDRKNKGIRWSYLQKNMRTTLML